MPYRLHGIAFELTRRVDIALAAAFLMATQPIFVHFARVGWEPASELLFLLGGLLLMLRAMRSSAPIWETFAASNVRAAW
jgi:hypothetical protein